MSAKFAVLAILALVGSAFAGEVDEQYKKVETEVLNKLYQNTNGDDWTNNSGWGNTADFCTWYGVTCDENGRVKGLYLSMNELDGQIPKEMGALVSLEALHLSGNQLSGPIPEELGKLVNLKTLYLGSNQLTGAVPKSIADLPKLTFINFSGNEELTDVPTLSKKKKHARKEEL
eukprot:TRINITY_DN1543_c0_g1::TRINITY_DN1543_c0_g1_i1::g.28252::m.28252 TRINITY_DN1543_c0_g1::TRINITY_DN1543_c0_g1_i1::g.28252  ORF type:complete len:187 (-),score=75.62,sp/Q9SKG5/SERK4_ARATH/35.34/9e-17,LRR_4/PF12799.2/0.009,LRR_4/PF12799.2/4.6e-08,LRR_4/PF12799.2/9.6e-09,LRR_8/PF13855.1/0.0074,LRR_8/PF13855.1/3.4e-07,LRR_1/PF00560.28/97,LRR_1/PF00560.28/0.02,LRR_1/PF00560.28/0.22,LRR_1/PF00560.28/1.9,LRR_6/PF13516.1/1.5e+04,LRR_6/PF13516.1/1.4e+02,LRR_6/PF13516.1/0.31,LRR_6/PF13516.1/0.083,LRR_6/PF135